MSIYLKLNDAATLEGTTMESLTDALKTIDADRKYMTVTPDKLAFFVLDKDTPLTGTGVLLPPKEATINRKLYNRMYVPTEIKDLPEEVRREAIQVGAFIIDPDTKEVLPVSEVAFDDLMSRLGIFGRATEYKSPALMEYLLELAKNQFDKVYLNGNGNFEAVKDGNSQKEKLRKKDHGVAMNKNFAFTVVLLRDHENPNIRKVFSFRSERYAPIPQEAIVECIHRMQMMGKPELHHWKLNHFLTESDVTFPEVGDEFSRVFGLKEEVIPCFRINTSDTGNSSLRISKYLILQRTGKEIPLRLPESEQEKKYELTKHFGRTDIDSLIGRINRNLFDTFKRVPQMMQEIMFMGNAPVKETLAAGFRAMHLQKHSGVVIAQDMEEKIVDALASHLPPVQDVLSTVYAVLFAADDEALDFLSENQREELRNNALLSVFPVDEYQELTKRACVPAAV